MNIMKQMKRNESSILRFSLNQFLGLSIAFLLIVTGIVSYYKTTISRASVTHPSKKKENINIPFNSNKDGALSSYIYELTLNHTLLSSGKFHVIPDDCIDEISVNGIALTEKQFPKGNCDCINGFYVDLKPLLHHGSNLLQLKISNTHGFYGLNMIDQTFYEKYIFASYLLLLLYTFNLRVFFRSIVSAWSALFAKYKVLLYCWCCPLILFTITLAGTFYFDNLTIWFWVLIAELLLMVFIPSVSIVYRSFRHGKLIAMVWCIMLVIFSAYLFLLSHTLYSYDYQGHIDYVHYIVNYSEVPVSWGAWSFYHPSLYYRCTALVWNTLNISDQMSNADFLKTMQAFSLMLFIVYSYWSLKTINLFFSRLKPSLMNVNEKVIPYVQVLTAVVFLCWPSNSIFAVRVGNDMMFDLFYAVSFYCTLKWWFSDRIWYFFLALLFASLDIWSKTNGFILFGVIGVLFIIRYFSVRRTIPHAGKYLHKVNIRYSFKFILLIVFSIFTCFYSFYEKIERYREDPKTRLVVGNANGLGADLIVRSDLQSFITFHPLKFIEIPFTSSYDDKKGRNSFWFFLLKSSLFGEFKFDSPLLASIAKIISFFFLILLGLAAGGWTKSFFKGSRYIPMTVNICLMLCSMMVFRIFYPYSSSSDFRYIFPALLPAVIFAGLGIMYFARSKRFLYLAILVCILFTTASFAFQVLTIFNYRFL